MLIQWYPSLNHSWIDGQFMKLMNNTLPGLLFVGFLFVWHHLLFVVRPMLTMLSCNAGTLSDNTLPSLKATHSKLLMATHYPLWPHFTMLRSDILILLHNAGTEIHSHSDTTLLILEHNSWSDITNEIPTHCAELWPTTLCWLSELQPKPTWFDKYLTYNLLPIVNTYLAHTSLESKHTLFVLTWLLKVPLFVGFLTSWNLSWTHILSTWTPVVLSFHSTTTLTPHSEIHNLFSTHILRLNDLRLHHLSFKEEPLK